jgi:hypothetical protein
MEDPTKTSYCGAIEDQIEKVTMACNAEVSRERCACDTNTGLP